MGCHLCGKAGVLATVPGRGAVVYCTSCRQMIAPEGWEQPCGECGKTFTDHVPFGVPGFAPNACRLFKLEEI